MRIPRTRSSFKEFLDGFNLSTFVIAMAAATAALWLNSAYVDRTTYNKDKEIFLLRVDALERETESIRYLVDNSKDSQFELAAVIVKIERLISKLITDDGEIILSREMKALEIDIAEIKRDISYIRDSKKQLTKDFNYLRDEFGK